MSQKTVKDELFARTIEKRVRKDLRISRKIGKEKTIKLLDDNTKEYYASKELLERIFGKAKTIKTMKKADKETLIPTNLDREIKDKLEEYLKNRKGKKERKTILQNVLEDEIIKYCKIRKLKTGRKSERNELIEMLEKKNQGTKFALAKSFEKIKLLTKK